MVGIRKNYKIFGVGRNDLGLTDSLAYPVWHSMHRRAYSEIYHKLKPSYKDVEVCENWQVFSQFIPWFEENYVEGFQLDKDLLQPYSRIYSPETCCFLPNEINCALNFKTKNTLPHGVSWREQSKAYVAQYSKFIDGKRKTVWLGTYESPEDAFKVYKTSKEGYIQELAEKWKGSLSNEAYNALVNYRIE